jgi:predicted nucleotidyltransferase
MLTLQDIRDRRKSILACAKKHGAFRVRIFGSVSRGEGTVGSDVDFLVCYQPERSLIDHIALIQELASLLQVPVDVVDETGLSPYIRDQVFGEAVPL